ncbi:hypothetical protein TVAG_035590 [Trichomonas vaginalis G3]|uniref:Uncharacterized protein n=1 Tax=Trichomonas vaginalis (strain ATCC PRA-98 / G3) TaxID=412133 RepID=A2DAN3_TRIV3|nr:hypothetical protein TVAGG3_0811850 [Trichomonas vaginalis G3]EAY22536.1 hypothetical protein TVAG_035590 [Trichomonas vaginalis G3]KAI5497269.1 hypothetical protein TVAGG3_0811850 [Trichomonas vaginalis G3]|eukprot:XP_001583522.1 hypothetical protein [Trichomonas vaginalis G3]
MNTSKPHRVSISKQMMEQPLQDRKLSDLLPGDFIRQIGFDPESIIFKPDKDGKIKRRATDTVVSQITHPQTYYRRLTQFEIPDKHVETQLEIANKSNNIECFLIELNDCTIDAFSTKKISDNTTDYVFVRDGVYTRLGKIVRRIRYEDCDKEALEIVDQDDGTIIDYFSSFTQLVKSIIPNFACQCNCNLVVKDVEMVSYQFRMLIRIKCEDISDPHIADLLEKLISVLLCPIELFTEEGESSI